MHVLRYIYVCAGACTCARVDTKPEADVGCILVLLFTLCAEAGSLPLNPVLTLSASQLAHCKLQMGCHMLQVLTWALGDLNSVLRLFIVSFLPSSAIFPV